MKMNLDSIAKTAVKKIVSAEEIGWPPPCWGFFYQPERPSKTTKKDNEDKKSTFTMTHG